MSHDRTDRVRLDRTGQGISRISAASLDDAHFGLGHCHARDRGLLILLTRILGRGEACEKLKDDDEMLALDLFIKRWNFGRDAQSEAAALSRRARSAAEFLLRRHQFLVLRHPPGPLGAAPPGAAALNPGPSLMCS